MTYFQAFILAIVQGLTEFLPVSSSGHLVIFQKIFGLEPPVFFDVAVHVGTLLAVAVFFRNKLISMFSGLVKKDKDSLGLTWLLFVGTLPAIVVGLFLESQLEYIFNSLTLVGFSLVITAGLLFSTKIFKAPKVPKAPNWQDSLFIGFFQALAILPGVSRSGSTITAGLWRKIDQKQAFELSFLLAMPAIIGGLILEFPDLLAGRIDNPSQSLLGMLVAGGVGYLALVGLNKVLRERRLWFFGFYCLLLGTGILVWPHLF